MVFQFVEPHVLNADLSQMIECAAECTTKLVLSKASVWRYQTDEVWQYRAFCGNLHALICMDPTLLPQA